MSKIKILRWFKKFGVFAVRSHSEILCTEVVTSLALAASVVALIYFPLDVSGFAVFVSARAYKRHHLGVTLLENEELLVIIAENLT